MLTPHNLDLRRSGSREVAVMVRVGVEGGGGDGTASTSREAALREVVMMWHWGRHWVRQEQKCGQPDGAKNFLNTNNLLYRLAYVSRYQ
jgi:hypothetical protein